MSRHWYVRRGGTILGPLTSRELRNLASTGAATETDHYREGETGRWTSGGKVRGLFERPEPPVSSAEATHADEVIGVEPPSQSKPVGQRRRKVIYLFGAGSLLVVAVLAWLQHGKSPTDGDLRPNTVTTTVIPRQADGHSEDLEELKRQVIALEKQLARKSAPQVDGALSAEPNAVPTGQPPVQAEHLQEPAASRLPELIRTHFKTAAA
jgi:hypothetical protein